MTGSSAFPAASACKMTSAPAPTATSPSPAASRWEAAVQPVAEGDQGKATKGSGFDRMGRFGVNRPIRTVALRPRTVPDPDGR
jgi:hypothetical protein